MNNNTQYFLITHTDLDGLACEVIARKFLEPNLTVFNTEAGEKQVDKVFLDQTMPAIKEYRALYPNNNTILFFTDCCPSDSLIRALATNKETRGNKFQPFILDHHATSVERCNKYNWAINDQTQCGALLFYYHLVVTDIIKPSNAENKLIQYYLHSVDAYDRWQLDSPYRETGELLNKLFHATSYEYMIKRGISSTLDETEQFILQLEEERRKKAVKRMIEMAKVYKDLDSFKYVFTLELYKSSDIASDILDAFPEVDYMRSYNPWNNTISLRMRKSNGRLDMGKLAGRYNGGGHKMAAGYPLIAIPELDTLLNSYIIKKWSI